MLLWFLDGRRLGDSDVMVVQEPNGTSTVTSVLTRTFSRDRDGGVLTCAVTNNVLEQRGLQPVMTNVTLRASRKSSFSFIQCYHSLLI